MRYTLVMSERSSGILLWRRADAASDDPEQQLEVLLTHPGGPYWEDKDQGSWAIPKGVNEPGESERQAALREFNEETGAGLEICLDQLEPLGETRNAAGRHVIIFAFEGDFDTAGFSSNFCTIEWPKKSGQYQEIPEMDAAEWFTIAAARDKLFPRQQIFLDRLLTLSQA